MKNFVWVLLLVFLVSVSFGSTLPVVTTAVSVGPSSASIVSYGAYCRRVLSCLSTETSPVVYPAPSPYMYSDAPDQLHWGTVTVDNSESASLWLGQVIIDPQSRFYGQKGTAYYVNGKFVGDGVHQFSADDISWQVASTDPAHSLNASGTLAGMIFGVDSLVGIDFGPDRVRSYDDIVYDYGTPALVSGIKVDEILYSGVHVAFDATSVGLSSVEDYVNSVGPFDITVTYTLNDGSGSLYSSSQTKTVVPEPITLALLGFGGLLLRKRFAAGSRK